MIELIPAIDIMNGRCVRLSRGDYSCRKVYDENPLEVAKAFQDNGLNRLHLVDLDGAKADHVVNYRTLEQIATHTTLSVDFGGGIKSDEDLRIAFECGADMVTGGSIAVKNRSLFLQWLDRYGKEHIILGADVRDGKISINGWLEDSEWELIPYVREYAQAGVYKVITTDISRDGMLEGCAVNLYESMLSEIPEIYLIASGGVASWNDIESFTRGKYYCRKYPGLSLKIKVMLAKRIIPCLDVKDGKTVKGTKFVDFKEAGDPVLLGEIYSKEGADELVYLDITASSEGRSTFTDLVKRVASRIDIPFTVGGGINSLQDIDRLLNVGADKVSLNSSALKNPQIIDDVAKKFGSQVCVIAIDANFENGNWVCYLNGGKVATQRTLFEWALEAAERGAGEILFTSMTHDGTRSGYAHEALLELHRLLPIPIIASGGAGTKAHFKDAFLRGKADAALAAGVFHFGEITIPELKKYLSESGIPVRR